MGLGIRPHPITRRAREEAFEKTFTILPLDGGALPDLVEVCMDLTFYQHKDLVSQALALYLAHISPYISPISRPDLAHISPISRPYLAGARPACAPLRAGTRRCYPYP